MTTQDETNVHGRVQVRGGSAAGGQRPAFDAGGDGAGHPALDATCLAGPWDDDGGAGIPPTRPATGTAAASAEQAEIRRLRKELDRAQMERDILKKAIAIFSGPPR